MSRLYRRNDSLVYWGDFTDPDGRRVQRSLRTSDKKVAKERLRLAELGATRNARGQKQRLMDAIDGMLASMHKQSDATKSMYQEKGRRLLKTLGNPFVSDINAAMLDRYIMRRRSKDREHGNATDHTIQKELITVRRALKYAVRSGTLHGMPAWPEHSAKYEPRTTWLTTEQFERMAVELDEPRRLWATLAATTGMRVGEVERLEWPDVDFDKNRVHVPGTKTAKSKRFVPLFPSLRTLLEAVPEKRRKGKVVSRWANVRRDLRDAVKAANAADEQRAKEYGLDPSPPIPAVSPNDLRRTFASWMVQNGADMLSVSRLMGHTSTRMLEKVYAQLSDANLEAAIARIPAFRGIEACNAGVPNMAPHSATPDHSRHSDEKG